MKILCITDLTNVSSDHSSIGGVFGGYLRRHCPVTLVRFCRSATESYAGDSEIVVPYRKKGRALEEVAKFADPASFDVVVVRNFTAVLRHALRRRSRYGFRVGFWNSFPHSYRRLFQARLEKKAVWRKAAEYRMRSFLERRLARQCDFLIAMTPEFRDTYFPDGGSRFFALPMGVDPAILPQRAAAKGSGFRAIYTGTIDHLRQVDLIVAALCGVQGDFVLDIYTPSRNAAVDAIAAMGDARIRLHPALPRAELFEEIKRCDLGIGAIPEHQLYEVSSPGKTLEYYALGVPVLLTHLPEYARLFDHTMGFFCHFTVEQMRDAFQRAVQTEREELVRMGERGRQVVMEKRNYEKLAEDLYGFLSEL